jgi:hypothetical protein
MRRHVPESPRWLVTHGWGRQADAADRQAVDGSKKPKLSIFCAFPWNKRLSRTRARRNRIESAQPELQSDEVENFLRNVAA